MLLATFIFAVMNVLIKYLPNIPAIEIILFRSIVSLVISVTSLSLQKIPLFGKNKKVLLLRGLAGALALMMFFTTLQHIPLASAVTLMFLGPIFTAILGIWIVKEKVATLQWVFFGISFLGILLIKGFDSRDSEEPSFGSFHGADSLFDLLQVPQHLLQMLQFFGELDRLDRRLQIFK